MRRISVVIVTLLLNIRYVCGYLAAGFLVSVPIRFAMSDVGFTRFFPDIIPSVLYGGVCAFIFVVLIPTTRIDWENLRLPEFKVWELGITRNATVLAAIFYLVCLIWGAGSNFLKPNVALIVFILMFFSYLKIKGHALVFREFYNMEGRDRTLPTPISASVIRQRDQVLEETPTVHLKKEDADSADGAATEEDS